MKNKFKYPLNITGSKEELKNVYNILLKIGYRSALNFSEIEAMKVDTKGIMIRDDKLIFLENPDWPAFKAGRTQVQATQIELIEALASMRDDKEPHLGEIWKMVKAGGYGCSPENDGCLAQITYVFERTVSWNPGYNISGKLLNSKTRTTSFYQVPIKDRDKIICRKATLREILAYYRSYYKKQQSEVKKINNPFNITIGDTISDAVMTAKVTGLDASGITVDSSILHKWYSVNKKLKEGSWNLHKPDVTVSPSSDIYSNKYSIKEGDVITLNSGETRTVNLIGAKSIIFENSEYWTWDKVNDRLDRKLWLLNTKAKKIVGYKCPISLFNGRIAAGAVFSEYSNHKLVMYCKEHMSSGVATEIVKTWEPVYEEEKLKFFGYEATIGPLAVKVGCKTFFKETVKAMNLLLENDVCSITIEGHKIEKEMVKTVLDKMKRP